MSFNAPSDPKFFKGKKVLPCEGALPRNLLKSVLASIENVTKSDQAFLYQVFPHSLPIEEMEVLYRCSFEEIMAFAKSYFTGYIFSRDRSWVLFTDADLDFTLVGGAKELISALHATAEIETLICDAATRVDYRGDLLNS